MPDNAVKASPIKPHISRTMTLSIKHIKNTTYGRLAQNSLPKIAGVMVSELRESYTGDLLGFLVQTNKHTRITHPRIPKDLQAALGLAAKYRCQAIEFTFAPVELTPELRIYT